MPRVEYAGQTCELQDGESVLDALLPDAAAAVQKWYDGSRSTNDHVGREVLRKTMDFEKAFMRAGGLLGAGSDPCCLHVIAGYGDQRNYELLIEAGFTPAEAGGTRASPRPSPAAARR